jgi:hypothetical protein
MRRTDEAADGFDRLTAAVSDRPTAQWRLLLDPDGHSGAENMATDRALLDDADRDGSSALRLYRWDPPCLSFGPTTPRRLTTAPKVGDSGSAWRGPNGSAVWHEHEVTYAIAAPIGVRLRRLSRFTSGSCPRCVLWVPTPLARRPPPPPPRATAPRRWRNLVGDAAGRLRTGRNRRVLQHRSILLDGRGGDAAVSNQTSDVSNATTLSGAGTFRRFHEIAEAVVAHFPTARPPPVDRRLTDLLWPLSRPPPGLAPLAPIHLRRKRDLGPGSWAFCPWSHRERKPGAPVDTRHAVRPSAKEGGPRPLVRWRSGERAVTSSIAHSCE